jgi:hypothetical protein
MRDSELLATIELGKAAEEFLQSEVGQYVIGRCKQIIDSAKNKLALVEPTDAKAVAKLQNEVWRAGAVPGFLNELLTEGWQARNVVETNDDIPED